MAAITYWVDGDAGNDANTGKSYAQRIKTISQLSTNIGSDGNGNDYTVNILNTTNYEMETSSVFNIDVDNQSSSTFHFRGVSDSSATPAMVTLVPASDGSTVGFFYIRECTSFLMEYFTVDASVDEPASDTFGVLLTREGSNGVVIQYCYFKGGSFATGSKSNQNIYPWENQGNYSGITTGAIVRYCVFENSSTGNMIWNTKVDGSKLHDCVILSNNGSPPTLWVEAAQIAGDYHGFYSNTAYCIATGTDKVSQTVTNSELSDAVEFDFYDNVFFLEQDSATPTSDIMQGGGGSATSSFVNSTQGYNIFWIGEDTPAGASINEAAVYDSNAPWNPDSGDLYTGDVFTSSVAEADVFNDIDSTYDWTPTGSSVALTIPADLRIIAETSSGLAGGLPGALPASVVDPSIVGSTTAPSSLVEGDTLAVVFTYTEDAGNNTGGTTVSLTYPSTFTLNSTKTSLGSVASDVWTITGTSAGGTAILTLNFTVNADVAGDTLDVVATITAHGSGLSLGGTTANDTDTVSFGGLTISGGVTNPDSPARVPVLDVIPTVEPRFELDVNTRFSTTRNRGREIYQRYDEEDVLFSEYRGAVVNLATNTSLTLNMGGVERASYMLYDSDNAIQVSLNGASFLPESKQMALSRGAFTSVKLKNNSTANAAEVFVVVVD